MRRFAKKTLAAITALTLLGGAPTYFGDDVFKAGIEAEAAKPKYLVTGECGENLTWSLNKSTGVLTIEGSGKMNDYTQATNYKAPWDGYKESYSSRRIREYR